MTSLDNWVVDATGALGLRADEVPADLRKGLLDLVEEVAGTVGPLAGPMTGYVLGMAVGRGMSPTAAISVLADLARAREQRGEESQDGAGPPAPGADTSVPAARTQQPPGD
jgi:hypothetical protein